MTFTGQVQGGQIVLPSPLPLPDGTSVKVEPVLGDNALTSPAGEKPMTFRERYADVIGKVELPPDAAEQHDHYLYGIPKK